MKLNYLMNPTNQASNEKKEIVEFLFQHLENFGDLKEGY